MDTISNERVCLERMVGISKLSEGENGKFLKQDGSQITKIKEKHSSKKNESENKGPYDNVIKLSKNGLNPKKISENLQISIEEIELILGLQESKI